jgi:rhodanese-related sulfurtransferase
MKKYNLLFLFTIVFSLQYSCKTKPNFKYTESIEVSQVDSILQNNSEIILVDVRTPKEHASGSISNSFNVDVKNDSFLQNINQFNREDSYLIYCRSGKRSTRAALEMEKLGFQKLYNLKGGYLAWSAEE